MVQICTRKDLSDIRFFPWYRVANGGMGVWELRVLGVYVDWYFVKVRKPYFYSMRDYVRRKWLFQWVSLQKSKLAANVVHADAATSKEALPFYLGSAATRIEECHVGLRTMLPAQTDLLSPTSFVRLCRL